MVLRGSNSFSGGTWTLTKMLPFVMFSRALLPSLLATKKRKQKHTKTIPLPKSPHFWVSQNQNPTSTNLEVSIIWYSHSLHVFMYDLLVNTGSSRLLPQHRPSFTAGGGGHLAERAAGTHFGGGRCFGGYF